MRNPTKLEFDIAAESLLPMVSTPSASGSFLSLRTFFYGLAASVTLLLLTGLIGWFWLTAHNPLTLLPANTAHPEAVMFVPKQAPAVVSLLVKPDRLESFGLAIVRPSERRRTRAELNRIRQALLSKTGLNYEQDIQPWLGGEITFAVTTLDFDRDRQNGQQPGYLLALASQDPERAREFLQLFWQKQATAGIDLVFEQYAGVKIIHANEESEVENQETNKSNLSTNSALTASAMVGDRFVLFANHPKVLRDAINNVQAPELSLSQTATYQRAIHDLPSRQLGLTFVNLPQLAQWIGKDQVKSSIIQVSGDEAQAAVSPVYESLMVALTLDRQGLVANTTLLTAAGQKILPHQSQSTPLEILQFVPATSPLVATGTNLQQFWHQISTELVGYAQLTTLVTQFQDDLQARWGLEQSDLFDWVKGEFALGLLPRGNRQSPDWFFVAEKTEGSDAEIKRLDAIAQQQGLSVGSIDLADQTVFVWTKLSTDTARKSEQLTVKTEVQGVRATVGNYEIFATSIEAMNHVLSASESSLAKTAEFQQAIATLDRTNDGYLFIDWPIVQTLLKQQLPLIRLAEIPARPLLNNLRSITVTSYGSDETSRRGAVLLQLQDW
jgi:hypothetical protein